MAPISAATGPASSGQADATAGGSGDVQDSFESVMEQASAGSAAQPAAAESGESGLSSAAAPITLEGQQGEMPALSSGVLSGVLQSLLPGLAGNAPSTEAQSATADTSVPGTSGEDVGMQDTTQDAILAAVHDLSDDQEEAAVAESRLPLPDLQPAPVPPIPLPFAPVAQVTIQSLVSGGAQQAASGIDADARAPVAPTAQLSSLGVPSTVLPSEATAGQDATAGAIPREYAAVASVDGQPAPAMGGNLPLQGTGAAATEATSASTSRAALPLDLPVNHPKWGEAVSERVTWLVNRNIQEAELRISPPHLGPVEIRLSLNNDQASVVFSAHHAQVRDALEASLPRLRDMLASQGINLQDANVSQQPFHEQRESWRHGQGGNRAAGSADQDGLATPSVAPVRIGLGMIDYYA